MSADWEFVQAAMVVVSFEFLALGVIVLLTRAFRAKQSTGGQAEFASHHSPEPVLLTGPYIQRTNPIQVVPTAPKFMAVGTEIDNKFEVDDSFGACWDEEADWAELVDKSIPPLRRRASVPCAERDTNYALPLARALRQRPASDDRRPIFGQETRVYNMSGHLLSRLEN